MRLRLFLSFLLITLLFSFTSAQSMKLTPRPPIYGIPAKTLPQGRWIFRGYAVFPHFTQKLNSKGQMIDLPDGTDFTSNSYTLKIRYGILNRLTAIVNIPYVHKKLSSPKGNKSGDGLGDVVGALLYKFYHNKVHRFLISGLLFTKSPTGKADKLKETELALGTGSFDAGLAVLPEWEFGKWDMRWSAFYIRRGKNKQNIDLGDVASFSWSAAYNFSRNFIAEGTLLYKTIAKDDANPQYHLFQFIPGIQYRLKRTFLVQFVFPLTIDAKMKFAANYENWFGLYYLF